MNRNKRLLFIKNFLPHIRIIKYPLLSSLILSALLIIPHHIGAATVVTLSKRQVCDVELLLNGGFTPLKGFLNKQDYESVVKTMRLSDGTLWPIPITLDVSDDIAKNLQSDPELELRTQEGILLATMKVEDCWLPNKQEEAINVYGTTDGAHPGVDYLFNQTKNYYVGGNLSFVALPKYYDFVDLRRTPEELKQLFKQSGYNNIVAFQTRNPMHRAHVELTIRALMQNDAHLLLHPAVGLTKPGDVDHFTRARCYKKVMSHYPEGSATLSLLPISMRMAGPREALWHAIIRKNYGCTHFIVGRDHAGPGNDSHGKPFYDPYDAQELVKKYANEIGIVMVPFKEMVYVPSTNNYQAIDEITPDTETLSLSGSQLRKLLEQGEQIPSWFSYPEVIEELQKTYPPKKQQGLTIFFTGLPSSGKSTLANTLAIKLMEHQERKVTLLDGDIIRTYLSNELGFSKEHRSINVRRVGFVASEISKNGGIALCALVSPYEQDRRANRSLISAGARYIEIYVNTPLEVCEKRDTKGLYAKARAGIVKNFTGVSDPYEAPQNPEIIIDASRQGIEEGVEIILNYLTKEGFF